MFFTNPTPPPHPDRTLRSPNSRGRGRLSILPTLLGEKATGRKQESHEMLYWEYGNQVAVRHGSWKAIKPGKNPQWALYDLSKDPSETTDLSSSEAGQLAKMQAFAQKEHEPVRPGVFLDPTRARHNRDRQAKFGFSGVSSLAVQNAFQRLDHPDLLPTDQIRLLSASSQNEGNDKRARYAIDGKSETIWHTQFSPKLEKHPHELILDLKKVRLISGVQYLARQDNGWNGTFGKTEFFSPKTERSFRTSLSPKPFQRKKTSNLPFPESHPRPLPQNTDSFGEQWQGMGIRRRDRRARRAMISAKFVKSLLLLFGHPHLPLPNARITDVV